MIYDTNLLSYKPHKSISTRYSALQILENEIGHDGIQVELRISALNFVVLVRIVKRTELFAAFIKVSSNTTEFWKWTLSSPKRGIKRYFYETYIPIKV